MDLKKSLLLVLTHPTWAIDHRTLCYFVKRGLDINNVVACNPKGSVIESRNRVVRDKVIPNLNRVDWFIFVDADNYPIVGPTDPFLQKSTADVVGAYYETNSEYSWVEPDNFHMGFVKIKSSVFREIQPPIFQFEYNQDATEITCCECSYLRKKVLQKEFKIERRGLVGHTAKNSWHNH